MKKRRPPADEAAFLAAYDPAAFEHPSVAVDVVLLGIITERLRVLLIERKHHPFARMHGLPGGFVGIDESLDVAAARVLETKVSQSGVFLEQLYTFGERERDPRMRVVSVAYYALVDGAQLARASESPNALLAAIAPSDGDPSAIEVVRSDGTALPLAFDHAEIVRVAVQRIRGKLDYAPIGYELLPERFTLFQLQRVHEVVAGRPFNKDSFRRKMLASGALAATGESQSDVGHRPAALYRYVVESAPS